MLERKLIRLTGFDYSKPRYYYFTICVKGKSHSFGFIENRSMHLSSNGIIALEQWNWLAIRYPYIRLVSFVVMPNHVHGIIYINSNYYVGNGRDHSPHNTGDQTMHNIYQTKIKPLPELIGAYKTTVSKRIHISGDLEFNWHKSYHDHIIRNTRALNIIKQYIEKNPENWHNDFIGDM